MLDDNARQAVKRIATEVERLFAKDLVCLAFYGSGAGDDFTPGASDLNFAIVVNKIDFDHLDRLKRHLPEWRKLGAGTPLLLDRQGLAASRDVFPMEFQDIKDLHQHLLGEDVFADLEIDWTNLRYEAEHEVRGKLLRLRALYVEVGADEVRLQRLLLDSVKTFVIVMRSLIRRVKRRSHSSYVEVLREFEAQTGTSFPVMRQLLDIKLQRHAWPADLGILMRAYLLEVETLVELVDHASLEPR